MSTRWLVTGAEIATAVNDTGVRHIALARREACARLLQASADWVLPAALTAPGPVRADRPAACTVGPSPLHRSRR